MNTLFFVFCFINIFIFCAKCAPTSSSNIFDLIQDYSKTNCIALSKNVLIDKNMTYLSSCKDVVLKKVPETLSVQSMNNFLCVGILEAEFRLCNLLSNVQYSQLPKSYHDLRESMEVIGKISPNDNCVKFKNFTTSFNASSISAELLPWMSKFNEKLNSTECSFLCSDFKGTNVFCSLLMFINVHIENLKNETQRQNKQFLPAISSIDATTVQKNTNENIKVGTPSAQGSEQISEITKKLPPTPQNSHDKVKADAILKSYSAEKTTAEHKVTVQSQASTDKKIEIQLGTSPIITTPVITTPVAVIAQHITHTETVVHLANENDNKIEPKRKEAEQLPNVARTNDIQTANVLSSAPDVENTADENKIEKPEMKVASEQVNKNIGQQTTDKVDTDIFEATVGPGVLKDKQDNFGQDIDDDGDEDDANFKLDEDVNAVPDKEAESVLPVISDQSISPRDYTEVEDSNFFAYFMFISVMFIVGYVVYHNKQKILALVLEGRKDRNSRRRPNTASYRKLNSNLEEAVTSKCSGSASHVIY